MRKARKILKVRSDVARSSESSSNNTEFKENTVVMRDGTKVTKSRMAARDTTCLSLSGARYRRSA